MNYNNFKQKDLEKILKACGICSHRIGEEGLIQLDTVENKHGDLVDINALISFSQCKASLQTDTADITA